MAMQTLLRADAWIGIYIVEYSVELIFVLANFVVLLVSFFYAWAILLGAGLGLVVLRGLFLQLIPLLIVLADPIVDTINAGLITFGLVENAVTAVIDVIVAAADILGADLKEESFESFRQITIHQYVRFLKTVVRECTPIDSTWRIAEQFVPTVLDDGVCLLFRAAWPMPFDITKNLYKVLEPVMSDPTPYDGNNCENDATLDNVALCSSIAVGYPILEILLPAFLLGLMIMSGFSVIFKIAFELVNFAFTTIELVSDLIVNVILKIEKTKKIISLFV